MIISVLSWHLVRVPAKNGEKIWWNGYGHIARMVFVMLHSEEIYHPTTSAPPT
jgi:hypothetical protein